MNLRSVFKPKRAETNRPKLKTFTRKDIAPMAFVGAFFFLMGPFGQTFRIINGEIESGETSIGFSIATYLIWVALVIFFAFSIVAWRNGAVHKVLFFLGWHMTFQGRLLPGIREDES